MLGLRTTIPLLRAFLLNVSYNISSQLDLARGILTETNTDILTADVK